MNIVLVSTRDRCMSYEQVIGWTSVKLGLTVEQFAEFRAQLAMRRQQ